jgi:hypothetical protein
MDILSSAYGGTFNCLHCGAFYQVTITRLPSRDRDYVSCECCGNMLAEWDSASVPSFRLIQRPGADPSLGQLNCLTASPSAPPATQAGDIAFASGLFSGWCRSARAHRLGD